MTEENSARATAVSGLPRSLDDGLQLRVATEQDVEALGDFYEDIFHDEGDPVDGFRVWVRDLASEQHPACRVSNFALVEDPTTGAIVSAGVLIPQHCSFAGIETPAGMPELIATAKAYRRRGLTRSVMGALHEISDAAGHHFQVIGGIPWFYRQFGYEYALSMKQTRTLPIDEIAPLKEDVGESYQVRPATAQDAEHLATLHADQSREYLVSTSDDAVRWRYDIVDRNPGSIDPFRVWVVRRPGDESEEGELVGYVLTARGLRKSALGVQELVLKPGIAWPGALEAILRALKQQGLEMAEAGGASFSKIEFGLPAGHSVWQVLDARLSAPRRPYAWYVRVPDLPGLLRHVAPALETRLADSPVAGFDGALDISFFRSGLRIAFSDGRLESAEELTGSEFFDKRPNAGFPPLTFLQLLFGHRSLAELRNSYPDCWATDTAGLLLDNLFPPRPSHLRTLT